MDSDVETHRNTEALKQVNYHLDRAMDAAKLLGDGGAAIKLRVQIVLANLQATNC